MKRSRGQNGYDKDGQYVNICFFFLGDIIAATKTIEDDGVGNRVNTLLPTNGFVI